MKGTRHHLMQGLSFRDPGFANGYEQGLKLEIQKKVDDVDVTLPVFQIIYKEDNANEDGNRNLRDVVEVKIGNYKDHDNASRMIYFSHYLQQKVFPFLSYTSLSHLQGYYNIELHDSYTYLEGCHDKYKNCLVWSKDKDDDGPILLPDIYHLANYGNRLEQCIDKRAWESKERDKIGFWGTTTGNRDPLHNERINRCFWFEEHDPSHEVSDCFITRIAQMTLRQILDAHPRFASIYAKPVTIEEQFAYKILLDIPGNTCSWDRIPMILRSNSLLFRFPCADVCSYHHLLKEYIHYVPVTQDDVLEKRKYYIEHPEETKSIIRNANAFAREFCTGDAAQRYMIGLFTGIAENQKKGK